MERMSKREKELRLRRMSELAGVEIYVETWAPGDGWVRYRVMRQLPSGGEGKMSKYVPYSQLETVMDAMQNAFELMAAKD